MRTLQGYFMLDILKICQHNVARGREITQSLFEVCLKEEASIICVQEPYLYQTSSSSSSLHHPLSHSSYVPITPTTHLDSRPRVMTYISRSFPFEITARYDLIVDPDFQILEIFAPHESFFINIYNEKPKTQHEIRFTLQRLFDLHISFQKPFLLLGDLNLHHQLWNPTVEYASPLAEHFVQFIHYHKAELLIDMTVIEELGGTFHRSNTKNTSIIDLVFASKFKTLYWQDWRYTESTGSDHEAIVFSTSISDHQRLATPQEPRYNIKNANWEKFEQNLR